MTIDTTAAARATAPGRGNSPPSTTMRMARMLLSKIPAPTAASARLMMIVASVSYFPCP